MCDVDRPDLEEILMKTQHPTPVGTRIALIDMDGTVADYDGQMQADLEMLRCPEEPVYDDLGPGKHPPHIERRMQLIKRQPNWWRNLPELKAGMQIVEVLRELGFSLHVLTKGPYNTTTAWTEKVNWVREHLPDAQITITEEKGLVYGKLLVDDWPPYIESWLAHRPRGLVIMPAHPWNKTFTHPRVIRYEGRVTDNLWEELQKIVAATTEV